MESEAKYTIVGFFVLIATALIVFSVLWLSGRGISEKSTEYTIYFKNSTLDGLQVNSWVTMKGIKVGNVESPRISPENIEEVEVVIKVNEGTPIKTDTRAVILRNLLTGLAYIDLVGSSQSAPLLTDIPPGKRTPVIPEGKSRLDAVAANLPEVLNNLTEVLGRTNEFLSDKNLQSLTKTLEHVETFSSALSEKGGEFSQLIENLNSVAKDARTVTRSLAKFTDNDKGDLKQLSELFVENSKRLTELLGSLEEEIGGLSGELKNSVRVVAQDVNNAANSVANAARAFASTAEHLSDLRTVVTGPNQKNLGPGEKVSE